jgi:hypothetical protein
MNVQGNTWVVVHMYAYAFVARGEDVPSSRTVASRLRRHPSGTMILPGRFATSNDYNTIRIHEAT